MLNDRVPVEVETQGVLLCGGFYDFLSVTGQIVGGVGVTCTTSTEFLDLTTGDILCNGNPQTNPTGFDGSKSYFRGPFPISGFTNPNAVEMVIYCDGSSLRYATIDGNGCFEDDGSIVWDCETMSGYCEPYPGFTPNCATGGTMRVSINGG